MNEVAPQVANMHEFKIVLAGDFGVGKSSYFHSLGCCQAKQQVTAPGAQQNFLIFHTNFGPIKINLIDTSGEEKFGGMGDDYYKMSHGAIIMFDVCNISSYQNVPNWYKEINRACENIPMVLVGNKVDQKERQVRPRNITFHRKTHMQYYDMSVLCKYQIEKPILWILRKITGCADLVLTLTLPMESSLNLEFENMDLKKEEENSLEEDDI